MRVAGRGVAGSVAGVATGLGLSQAPSARVEVRRAGSIRLVQGHSSLE